MTTELDDYWPPAPVDDMALERKPKVCRHPRRKRITEASGNVYCGSCHKLLDPAVMRRGRSSRRLGGDTERRIEKVYGPVKIGERGDPVDHLGRVWRWQSKATRALPPKRLALIQGPVGVEDVPLAIQRPLAAMEGLYARKSVVIRSFVSRGIRARDWLFVRWDDGLDELGLTLKDPRHNYFVIPGDWWLDHFGKDSPA